MTVHLINPSNISFGVAVIVPRWMYVLASATPAEYGEPRIVDETLEPTDFATISRGDVVGIGIHTLNASRGYEIGNAARERGATVIFGGVHATLYPEEAHRLGGANAVVQGDGDSIWPRVLQDASHGTLERVYTAGRIPAAEFLPARWELLPPGRYMWGSVQTLRGCPKHCSFCSVWRMDGQQPRVRGADAVVQEILTLRRQGYRFVLLADDNFYPVSRRDLELARRQGDRSRIADLTAIRNERFELMEALSQLPSDMVFFTQITMEAAEDPAFLDAMADAHIKGALVGIESITSAGLKDVYKEFNLAGAELTAQLRTFREHGIHVLGSFIFGLASDRPATFDATCALAEDAGISFAQFVMLTPFPGTVDFAKWESSLGPAPPCVEGVPITRHWLIPPERRPKIYAKHPTMSAEEIRCRTQSVWDQFYGIRAIWRRSKCVRSLKARIAFTLISKLYRQMYANTGIATDSARRSRSNRWARGIAAACRPLFVTRPDETIRLSRAPATTHQSAA